MTTDAENVLRRLLRRLPEALRWRWHRYRHQAALARRFGFVYYARWMTQRTWAWLLTRVAARTAYVTLSPAVAAARRRSDTVFIFGSGYSLNDLTPGEWARVAEHDVFGFGGFIYQRWVRVDFHLLRSWDPTPESVYRWPRTTRTFATLLEANPRFHDAVSVVQTEHSGIFANTMIGLRLLPRGSRLLAYWTARRLSDAPSRRWRDGIVHAQGALVDCVNVAYLLGWKHIVLIGVDLYDHRYFWAPPDATMDFDDDGNLTRLTPEQANGSRWHDTHLSARRGVVELLARWGREFARDGVTLSVYNPRSLLAEVLPVYERSGVAVTR